jgi:3-isopropylmalate/(R)-2-methylmalate dehydratase small subunit
MEPFTRLTGIAAPLMLDNIDTDQIIPKQFLTTVKRTGLGKGLFYDYRTEDNGTPKEGFILNQEPWDKAKILIAGENFGCGSSREHAPWALLDFGIRCVIAKSFADIFYNNCFKNGILPIVLPEGQIDTISTCAGNKEVFTVDLNHKIIAIGDVFTLPFTVDKTKREYLLEGVDDIALTEKNMQDIETYEKEQKEKYPWLDSKTS